jgi:hypothetical protein
VTALLQQEDQANMLLKLIGVWADLQGTDQTNTEHELVGQVVPLAIEPFAARRFPGPDSRSQQEN